MKVFFVLLLLLCSTSTASAQQQQDHSSANYKKEKKEFLPGEEVVTPTGQRMKVWSTEGPVEVGQLNPQPSAASNTPTDVHVIVDDKRQPHSHKKDSFTVD